MFAAEEGKAVCLSALVQAKADVNLKDNVRWSAADVVWVPGRNIGYLVSRLNDVMHR